MHQPQQQTTFIVLRANGWSLGKISEKLKIPKSTLFDWDGQHRTQIHALKSMQVEKLQEEYTPSFEEELQHLAAYLARVEQALQLQRFDQMRPEFLLKTALDLRARLNKLRTDVPVMTEAGKALAPLPVGGCLSRAERPVLSSDYQPVDHAAWLNSPEDTSRSPDEISCFTSRTDTPTPAESMADVIPLTFAPPENIPLAAASNTPLNRQFSAPKSEAENRTFPHENKIFLQPDASSSAPCENQNRTTVRKPEPQAKPTASPP